MDGNQVLDETGGVIRLFRPQRCTKEVLYVMLHLVSRSLSNKTEDIKGLLLRA